MGAGWRAAGSGSPVSATNAERSGVRAWAGGAPAAREGVANASRSPQRMSGVDARVAAALVRRLRMEFSLVSVPGWTSPRVTWRGQRQDGRRHQPSGTSCEARKFPGTPDGAASPPLPCRARTFSSLPLADAAKRTGTAVPGSLQQCYILCSGVRAQSFPLHAYPILVPLPSRFARAEAPLADRSALPRVHRPELYQETSAERHNQSLQRLTDGSTGGIVAHPLRSPAPTRAATLAAARRRG
jgi:hypothetical protein